MQKILCIASIAIAGLLFLLFLLDMIAKFPFGANGGTTMHIGFMFASALIITFGILALREQR